MGLFVLTGVALSFFDPHVSWVSWGWVGLFPLAGVQTLLLDKTEGLLNFFRRDVIAISCFSMAGAMYLFYLS